MNIFFRGNGDTGRLPSVWPEVFSDFLAQQSVAQNFVRLPESQEHELTVIPHGNCGAQVVLSRNKTLEGAWRVAAFHSAVFAELEQFDPQNLAKADALVVRGPFFKAPLAIATADCLAVAVTHEIDSAVRHAACFHAGWRGYTAGIQGHVFQWLGAFENDLEPIPQPLSQNIHISIGPAIAGASYPCGDDVRAALDKHLATRLRKLRSWTPRHEHCFQESLRPPNEKQNPENKIFPDLQVLMLLELHALGIPLNQVAVLREDTFTSDWWPSHRRAMAQGLAHAGRLFTQLCPAACPQVPKHVSNP